MTRVAVVGAAGFVGAFVVEEALRRGYDVVAVARATGHLHLERYPVTRVAPEDVQGVAPVDAVINLAYPTSGSIYDVPRQNRSLLETIGHLAGQRARVIHTSTLAVFGFGLERAIRLAPVPWQRDFLYVESKVELEQMLLRRFSGRELAIVRLGNVWGPASATWTAALSDKLLFGDPVGVQGADGYSNVTDVANVASYLCDLVEAPLPESPLFSHLAEFAETPWSWWLERLSRVIGCQPVRVTTPARYAATLGGEMRGILARCAPSAFVKDLVYGRFVGSWWRTVIRAVPSGALKPLKRRYGRRGGGGVAVGDPGLLAVMVCSTPFVSAGLTGWRPMVDREESWRRAAEYLAGASFGPPATRT